MAQTTITLVGWKAMKIKGDVGSWEDSGGISAWVHFLGRSEQYDIQTLGEMSRAQQKGL